MNSNEQYPPWRFLICFSSIEDFHLSVRTANVLRARGIELLGELLTHTETEVRAWSDRRMLVLNELKDLLNTFVLSFFPEE